MRRARFVVVCAAANAAAIALSGAATCGFQRTPPVNLVVVWFGANALTGFIGAPAIENVALGCTRIGIGPDWIESSIGWAAAARRA